jgi:pimeloyl-ACP methyl ester carboxylesterase
VSPTVVLLHAFPLDHRLWNGVVDSVAAADWDVVVPDLRGFGGSAFGDDLPDDEPSLATMARDVLAALDRMGLANVVLGGLSLGGYVAMEIARQDPDRIAALVLADTKASADADEARENRLRVADQVLAAGSTEALARAMLPNLLGPTTTATRPGVVETVRGWIHDAEPAGVAWAQRAMAARPDSHDDLARLTVPSLVLWGAEDALAPEPEQHSMLAVLRDAREVVVPGAGHLTAVEDPSAVTEALLAFLHDVRRLPQSS